MILIRIALGIAIAAGIATIILGNVQLRKNINVIIEERAEERRIKEDTQRRLSATNKVLKATSDKLASEEKAHAGTKEQLAQTTARAEQLQKETADLTQSLETARTEVRTMGQRLAPWVALGLPVEQVQGVIVQNKELRTEVEALKQEHEVLSYNNKRLRVQLNRFIGTDEEQVVEMPTGLKGTVTQVDPKWDFVVLDIGQKEGVLEDGVFLVNRDGRLVAKLKVTGVSQNQSIANVMPGWKLADVMEGDQVIY